MANNLTPIREPRNGYAKFAARRGRDLPLMMRLAWDTSDLSAAECDAIGGDNVVHLRRASKTNGSSDPTALRLALKAAGYSPIPVNGKKPPLDGWQNLLDVSPEEINGWKTFKNTGLLCKRTPGFDIDILDAAAADAVEQMVRERFKERGCVLARTGRPPKRLIPFRTDAAFKKIKVPLVAADGSTEQKIEFLCKGQQFVAFGTHPDTHQPYRWSETGEPGAIRLDELPEISADEAQQLVDDVIDLLIKDFGYQRVGDNDQEKPSPFGAFGNKHLDWRKPVQNILAGVDLHDNIRDFAASLVTSNVSVPAAEGILRALMQNSMAPRGERWQDRFDDIPRAVAGAEKTFVVQWQGGEEFFDPWAQFVVPDFPLDILPPVAHDFVTAQSTVIGVDRSSMAMCVLAALSGAINHSFTLKMMRHGDWYVSPRLWVLLYGDASKKKTPAFNAATKALEEHQREIQQLYKDELAFYEMQSATAGKGEKPEKPQPPPRWVMFDTSIEKLGEILSRSNKGLLFKKDEIAGWVGQMEKYGGSSRGAAADRGFWVQAYDGGYYVVDRINRGEIPVDNLSVSIIGGIQPKRLAELKGLTSDGLLQRFIPTVMGPTKLPQDCPCDTTAFHDLLRRLIRLKPETMLTFSDGALAVMKKLQEQLFDLEQHSGGLADGFQSFVGKLSGVAGSLALLLHLASEPRGGFASFAHHGVVGETTVENVRRLIVNFIIPHALEFYRSTEAATNGDRLAQLASWILTNAKERFVASDLTSNIASFRGLTLYEVNERVSPLIAAGWLKPDSKEPYCRAWNVNPAVFIQFAARTKVEEAAKQQLALAMNSFRKPRG